VEGTDLQGRRGLTALAALAVATATILAGSAALKPPTAQAWAWSNTCQANIMNQSGTQAGVRPIAYLPVLPSAASLALYASMVVVGVPAQGVVPFSNSGYPVPSWGCHTALTFVNPGPNVACAMSAPTTGANHFSCGGNSTIQIIRNDNYIVGNVMIHAAPGSRAVRTRAHNPRTGRPAMLPRALPGSNGWRSIRKMSHLGIVSRAMKMGSLPDSCQRGGHHGPNQVSSTQLVHRGGGRGVGAVVGTFDGARRAHQTASSALSRHSMHCLALLLTVPKLHTRAAVRPRPTANLGQGLRGRRVVIHRRRHGEQRRAAFVDVVGSSNGRHFTVVLLQSTHRPTGARVARAAVQSALDRIGS
jgi:hypothetical protein